MVTSGPITGSWVLSVAGRLTDDDKWVWSYVRDRTCDQDWTASVNEYDLSKGRVPLHSRATRLLKKLRRLGRRDPLRHAADSTLLKWLAADKNGEPLDLEDRDASIVLNHFVVSQSLKSVTVVTSAVGSSRSVETRGLQAGRPSWFYSNRADGQLAAPIDYRRPVWEALLGQYVLAFPDLFFMPYGSGFTSKDPASYEDMLAAHRQRTEFSVLGYRLGADVCTLNLRVNVRLCRYERGALCNCIPIPGKPVDGRPHAPEEELASVRSPEIVITSPVVQHALASLSDIWQGKASAVLISAPPGSGKEHFALSIPYGSGRNEDAVQSISLANGSTEEQEHLIFGCRRADGSIEDGLLANAKGSTLFVDEAHYPPDKSAVRAALLRALEAKEYYPIGSTVARKVEDVQWVFATSLPLERGKRTLRDVPPKDFWTRMTHLVRVEHPLDAEANDQSSGKGFPWRENETVDTVVQDLFKLFWWDRTEDYFGTDPAHVLSAHGSQVNLQEGDVADEFRRGYIRLLLEEKRINALAESFASELARAKGRRHLSQVSIRAVRSMVSRIFSKCVGEVMGGVATGFGALFAGKCAKEWETGVRPAIRNVIEETVQITSLRT